MSGNDPGCDIKTQHLAYKLGEKQAASPPAHPQLMPLFAMYF
jgi:hypothetical protein